MRHTGPAAVSSGENEPVSIRVARSILKDIQSGKYQQGKRLPSEHDLSKDLRVSRPSLREALSALQFAGYVESRQGYGSVVLASSPRRLTKMGADHQRTNPIEVLEARLLVEPEAIRLAALDPERGHLREARSILDGMWVAVEAASELGVTTDIHLHAAFVNICRNHVIRELALLLLERTNPPEWKAARTNAWAEHQTREAWAVENEATLSAIQARQPERAWLCARRHLLSSIQGIADRMGVGSAERRRLDGVLARHLSRGQVATAESSGAGHTTT
jgi:DNA-binding FadR family transcriptional regulator